MLIELIAFYLIMQTMIFMETKKTEPLWFDGSTRKNNNTKQKPLEISGLTEIIAKYRNTSNN